jgi:hypothetical protein
MEALVVGLLEVMSRRAWLGLVEVPALVRAAGAATPAEVRRVHRALRALSAEGVLELRPWSSPDLVSAEDLALMVPGPRGDVLGYVRLLARRSSIC